MSRATFASITLLIISAALCSAQTVIPESERDALVALYGSTGGDGWYDNSGWNGPAGTEGLWFGVMVRDGHVKELHLNGNNLVGSLPEQLGDLTFLEELRIQDNDLHGGFPSSFWDLSELLVFVADNNQDFGGVLLPEIGNLSHLRIFSAELAGLDGTIPTEFGNLSELNILLLGKNDLSGPFPASLANCSQLYALDLYKNQLEGPIPDGWRQLTELTVLAVGNLPRFGDGSWGSEPQAPQGPFPVWIGELTNLRSLYLRSVGLTGEIPASICNLKAIEMLNLDSNHLTGTIPTCVAQLPSVYFLSMCDNLLEGSIPSGLGGLEALEVVDLSGNLLNGDIPPDIAQIPNLQRLLLGFNRLSGPIPLGFGTLQHLSWLDLMSNHLTGTIPPDLGDSPALEFLRLANNQLTGPIPGELGNISTLSRLILSENPLDPGPIPTWVGDLSNLIALYLYDTNREGPIPREIGNLTNLFAMNIGMNHLTGPIPDELCDLERLSYFQIADADLEGEIPSCLTHLPHLVSFKLDRNRLWGAVPEGFSDRSTLRDLSLGGNALAGLPDDLLDIQGSSNVWLGSNSLPVDDPAANAFLNAQNPDSSPFEATQTVAPVDFAVVKTAVRSVELRWTPILYQDYSGRYEIFAASGLGFELAGSTSDKKTSSILIEGLKPGTTYRFKIRTVTDPVLESANPYHLNKNTVVSSFSDELVVTTLEAGSGAVVECSRERFDLNDNMVPAGWQLEIKNGGHLSDGKLWGQPTDGGCWLGRQLDSGGQLTTLDFSWDGSLETSYWGLYTGVEVTMVDGGVYTLLHGSWIANGENNFVRFKEPWDVGWDGSQQYSYPLENGEFSYDLNLRDETAHFVSHRISDDSLAFDHTEPMQALLLDDIQRVEFAVYATTGSANWLDNPTLTMCVQYPDEDEDGVPDASDECPGSAPTTTVVIDGCDSGVVNHVGEDGCTIVDLVDQIAATAVNHGRFASGVAHLLNGYVDEGILTAEDQDSIQSCAGRADIP